MKSFLAIAPQPIILELTEHARIEDYDGLRDALASYGSGVQLAIDDAGAGYASLRHILELRPAFVKLDLSIVRGIEADPCVRPWCPGSLYFAAKTGIGAHRRGGRDRRGGEHPRRPRHPLRAGVPARPAGGGRVIRGAALVKSGIRRS